MAYTLLAGLKVLELGRLISAPYCGKLLADMGAEVTKIEPPATGDPARQYGPFLHDDPHRERSGLFLYLNAHKQGVTLNLATPNGQSILRELVARSDALVHNLPVQDMGRLGLDYEGLSQVNPGLVMASITPFGLTGPYRHYNAYDINLAAAGGICTGLGEEGREPLTFGTPQVGYFAGMAAASSIVMALMARDSVGSGQHIDIAEVETMAGVYNGPEALMAVYQWRMTRRTGHHALDFPYPNCVLRCKDGYIFVGAPEGRQRLDYMRMGRPIVGDQPDPEQNPMFHNVNRNKLSITLNTTHQKGVELARKLVARCDVIIENFSPGVMGRLGLGYEELRRIKPDLIMASISSTGQTGPLRNL